MITIKLMTDYDCWPLWWYAGTDKIGNIHPKDLQLKKTTITRLQKWADRYDSYLDRNDPSHSPPQSTEEQLSFESEGIAIWKILEKELVGRYRVVYYSEFKQKVLESFEEIK